MSFDRTRKNIGVAATAVLIGCMVAAVVPSNAARATDDRSASSAPKVHDASTIAMERQRPLVRAAIGLRKVIEHGNDRGYAGIILRDDHIDLYWHGSVPSAVAREAHTAAAPVRSHRARYSLATLQAEAARLMATISATDSATGGVYGVKVPADGSGLIAVTSGSPGRRAQRFASRTRVHVQMALEAVPHLTTGRIDDTAPFYGGGAIVTGNALCSAGFGVQSGGRTYILTAGHCGAPGLTFTNGNRTATIGAGAAENVGHDLLLVNATSAGRIWDGGGIKAFETRPQFTKGVSGYEPAFPGEYVCQSGAMSGAVCGMQNSTNFTFAYRNGAEVYSDLVETIRTNGIAIRAGDSGGPVFTLNGTRVIAKGINSGSSAYAFTIAYNGRCLDADLNTITTNGTKVQLWDCNGQRQQQWWMYGDGTIRSAYNGRCLDADLNTITTNGTKVQLWDCNGQRQQQWNYAGSGSGPARSGYNGRCLDADLNTITTNGTKVQLWDCNGQSQQQWNVPQHRMYYQDFLTANRDFGVVPLTSPN